MWWHNAKPLIMAALLVLMAGCSGVTIGQLDGLASEQISRVAVIDTGGRAGQIYARALRRALYTQTKLEPAYSLSSVISVSSSDTLSVRGATSTFKKMSMSASFKLIKQADGQLMLTDSVTTDATLGTVSSLFGQDQSEAHARDRMAELLAQRVVQRLQLYFLNQPDP
jgi:hypothetical protein